MDPEATGREMAEALVESLERLKRRHAGRPELAVEGLKALLPEITDALQPTPDEAPKKKPFSFEV